MKFIDFLASNLKISGQLVKSRQFFGSVCLQGELSEISSAKQIKESHFDVQISDNNISFVNLTCQFYFFNYLTSREQIWYNYYLNHHLVSKNGHGCLAFFYNCCAKFYKNRATERFPTIYKLNKPYYFVLSCY